MLEVVVVISIGAILATMAFSSLRTFWRSRTVDVGVENVLSIFSRARLDTISSRDGNAYGVHLEGDRLILYVGPTYDAATTTKVTMLMDPALRIKYVSLLGGGTDVLFKKWTGGTDQYGTFVLDFASGTTSPATITVSGTGISSF